MVSCSLDLATAELQGSPSPDSTNPAHDRERDTFTEALLELPCEYRRRNPVEWVVSFAAHVIVVLALIIAPLFFTQTLNLQAFRNTWLVSPAPPAPPPPAAIVQRTVKPVARLLQAGRMMAPSVIPKKILIIKEAPPPSDPGVGVTGGVPGGIPGGQVGGVLGGIIGAGLNPVAAIAPPAPPAKRIVRVGGNVKPPRPISTTPPVYPAIAKSAKIQGTVVIDAIIDTQGNVVQARAVSGPGLLISAALQAVTNWKYEPTLLNGEPTSVEMHVVVNFVLGQL
jgi:periplasmic protein TonB